MLSPMARGSDSSFVSVSSSTTAGVRSPLLVPTSSLMGGGRMVGASFVAPRRLAAAGDAGAASPGIRNAESGEGLEDSRSETAHLLSTRDHHHHHPSNNVATNGSSPNARSASPDLRVARSICTPGIALTFVDVSMVQRFWPPLFSWRRPRIVMQQACGIFAAGTVSAVVAVDHVNAVAALHVLAGGRLPTEGCVLANGIPVIATSFRQAVGFVGPESAAVAEFSAERNVAFALQVRCRRFSAGDEDVSTNVGSALRVVGLRPGKLVSAMSQQEHLRLRIAMELVMDPPALFVVDPLDGLDWHEAGDVMTILATIARELTKTVVVTLRSVPLCADAHLASLLLLGRNGLTLYSGSRRNMQAYFDGLELPASLLETSALPTNRWRRASAASVTSPSLHGSASPSGGGAASNTNNNINFVDAGNGGGPTTGLLGPQRSPVRRPEAAPAAVAAATTPSGAGGASNDGDGGFAMSRGDSLFSDMLLPSAIGSRHPTTMGFDSATNENTIQRSAVAATPVEGATPIVAASGGNVLLLLHSPQNNVSIISSVTDINGNGNGNYDAGSEASGPRLVVDTVAVALDVVTSWADSEMESAKYAAAFYDSRHRAALLEEMRDLALSVDTAPLFAAPLRAAPTQVEKAIVLLKLKALQTLRLREFYVGVVVLWFSLGLCGWMMGLQSHSQQGMQNIRGILFFMFSVLIGIDVLYVHGLSIDREVFVTHRDGGFYGSLTYLIVVLLRSATVRAVLLVPFAIFIMVVLRDMNNVLLLLGVTSFVHNMLIFLVVISATEVRYATILVYCIDAVSIVLSGFLVNDTSLPTGFEKLSLIRYGYGAAVAHELRNQSWSCDANNATMRADNTTSYCYSGDEYLNLQGFIGNTTNNAAGQLWLILLVVVVLCGIRLRFMK